MNTYEDYQFEAFPKMGRLFRDIVITEKLDGTNAQIFISEDGSTIKAGSRTRWITPGDDNYGFARWVEANKKDLSKLGPGRHYGEWWGEGIQRKYNIGEKRFSLFNTERWKDRSTLPACCHVVPVLYKGQFNETSIYDVMWGLEENGSVASPGFMKPEGIIVYHTAARIAFKYTLEGDGHKGS